MVRMKRGPLLIAVLVFLLGSGSCSKEEPERREEKARTATKDTDVILTGIDGSTTTLSEFEGRVIVLNFLATWSKDCLELVNTMNKLHRKFGRRVQVLAVVIDDKGEHSVRRFIEEHGIQYPIFLDGERTAKRFGGVGKLPTTLLYRKNGTLYERIKGNRRKSYYEDKIVKLITDRL
jgi:thiol-disulfide isomerase/thioredoxin